MKKKKVSVDPRKQVKALTQILADRAVIIERLNDRAKEGEKDKERLSAVWNLLEGERAELLARVSKIDALLQVMGRTASRHGSPSY